MGMSYLRGARRNTLCEQVLRLESNNKRVPSTNGPLIALINVRNDLWERN